VAKPKPQGAVGYSALQTVMVVARYVTYFYFLHINGIEADIRPSEAVINGRLRPTTYRRSQKRLVPAQLSTFTPQEIH
jgi:hypothetical protein